MLAEIVFDSREDFDENTLTYEEKPIIPDLLKNSELYQNILNNSLRNFQRRLRNDNNPNFGLDETVEIFDANKDYFEQGFHLGYTSVNLREPDTNTDFDYQTCIDFQDFMKSQVQAFKVEIDTIWKKSGYWLDKKIIENRLTKGHRGWLFAEGYRQGYCGFGCHRRFRCNVAKKFVPNVEELHK